MKPGYKQTEVGVIPEDWEVKPLRRLALIQGGIAKNGGVTITDPISVYYLRVANVQDGFLDLAEMNRIQISRQDLKRYTVLPGDVLMNEGGDLDQLGRGAIWRGEFSPCVHQNHVFVVRCGSELIPDYLNIWTRTASARRFFLLTGKQTTNLASISKSSVGELPVALPRSLEQRAITEALSDVDGLISALDALIAKRRDLKKAAMQQLLTAQTRLPGFSGEWVSKELGDLSDISKGTQLHSSVMSDAETYPHYNGGIEPSGFTAKSNTSAQTIIISEGGNSCGFVQFVNVPFWCGGHCYTVSPRSMNQMFLYHSLKGRQSEIMALRIGSGLPNVQKSSLQRFTFEYPSDPTEQTAIATVLSDMDAELAALEARREKTRALKQGMMQQLLTGQIRLV